MPHNVSGMCHGFSYSSCGFFFCCLCNFRSLVKVSLLVVALCRRMTSDNASGKVDLFSCGWYMFESLRSLALVKMKMRRPYGAWSSSESKEMGWEVISNAPVGTVSRSGLIG